MNSLRLSEIGDALAGACAPLAFLWLVCGYYQQQIELRLNTEAVLRQSDELKKSVRAQLARDRPIFSVIGPEYKYDDVDHQNIPILILVNNGGQAQNIVLRTSDDLLLGGKESVHFKLWSMGEEREFYPQLRSTLGDRSSGQELVLCYQSLHQMEYTQYFSVQEWQMEYVDATVYSFNET